MGSCVSTNVNVVVKDEPVTAAILILCNKSSNDRNVEFVAYKNRVRAAETVKEHVIEGEEECCICSWDSVQPGQMMVELKKWQYLELGEIYFLLPRRKFRFKLTVQDISSFLFKANSTLKSLPFSPLSTYEQNDHEPCTHFQFQDQIEHDIAFRDMHALQREKQRIRSFRGMKAMNSNQRLAKHSSWKSRVASQLDTITEVV